MKNASRISRFALAAAVSITALTADAGTINMDHPFRAAGRENDVRVDAQLLSDVVRAGSPIAVTYQVQNFSSRPVAVAEKLCSASYDTDSRMITLSVGSEIPPDGNLPKMVTIAPGEKKTFSVATNLHVALPSIGTRTAPLPRFLQVKASILRNLDPFADLLSRQSASKAPPVFALSDEQFDQWLEGNDTIFLNALPIRYEMRPSVNFDAPAGRRRR